MCKNMAYIFIQVFQKYRLPYSTEKYLKNSISAATVTPERLERIHGNIVKRANACLDANGQTF
jgi:hypothetical protein